MFLDFSYGMEVVYYFWSHFIYSAIFLVVWRLSALLKVGNHFRAAFSTLSLSVDSILASKQFDDSSYVSCTKLKFRLNWNSKKCRKIIVETRQVQKMAYVMYVHTRAARTCHSNLDKNKSKHKRHELLPQTNI